MDFVSNRYLILISKVPTKCGICDHCRFIVHSGAQIQANKLPSPQHFYMSVVYFITSVLFITCYSVLTSFRRSALFSSGNIPNQTCSCYPRKNSFSPGDWRSLFFNLTVSSVYFVFTCHLCTDLILSHGFLSLFRISMENSFRASPVVPKQEQLDSPSLLVRAHLRILLV